MMTFKYIYNIPLVTGETVTSMASYHGSVVIVTNHGRVFLLSGDELHLLTCS